jgi:uncharacterized protein YegP (UPF0339 family)
MATAPKKVRDAARVAGRVSAASNSAPIEFLVFEDNGGDFHWTIVRSGGESLAQSGPFATHEDASHAAQVVRDGAGSARFGARPRSDGPVDLVARRDAAQARDDSEAERWLDEGGSFSSEAVAKWPAQR